MTHPHPFTMPPIPSTTTTSTGEGTTPNPTTALATTHTNTTHLPEADSSTSVIDFAKEEEIHSISSDDDNERSDLERAETKEVDIEACNGEVKEKGKGVLGNVLSHISTKSSWKDPGPPPDGGLNAWMQVALGHLVILNTWGFINSFGVFQTYYVSELHQTPSAISWIGSMQVFLIFFIGTFTGRLTDAGYFLPVFTLGSLLGVFGMFMTSLSTQYWQIFLAQGVCCGLGNGCLFCPALSTLSTYFSSKRALAIGIAASGSATGGIIFPLMVQRLLPQIGFPWTMRALAFVQLFCLSICVIGIRQRVPPRRTGAIIDKDSFKDIPYVLFALGMFFNFWGVYIAFFYIGSFARDIIGFTQTTSINLIIVLNAVGLVGRVLPNHLADRFFGPQNTLIPCTTIAGLLSFIWAAVGSRGGLYVWVVVYGIAGASVQGLFPATLSSLTTDLSKAGTRMGQVFTVVSFAVLTGPPIAGQLIQKDNGGYLYAQVFAGCALMAGTGLVLVSRLIRSRKFKAKM